MPSELARRVFSAEEFRAVTGLDSECAELFLSDFVEAGVVRRLASGWTVTAKGLRLSWGLAAAGGRDHAPGAREVTAV